MIIPTFQVKVNSLNTSESKTMAESTSKGKSISELSSSNQYVTYMENEDLAVISKKTSTGWTSKAAAKEAFEKIIVPGDTNASSRPSTTYKSF